VLTLDRQSVDSEKVAANVSRAVGIAVSDAARHFDVIPLAHLHHIIIPIIALMRLVDGSK